MVVLRFLVVALLVTAAGGCGSYSDSDSDLTLQPRVRVPLPPSSGGGPYPNPDAWPANSGPGGPQARFAMADLGRNCAYLDGGPEDRKDHHNLVTMYDGWLLMPWAPESGRGGITLFDVSNPCSPAVHAAGTSEDMRETHSIGFSHFQGAWAVTNAMDPHYNGRGGILFWDLSDTSAPEPIGRMDLPGFSYPDAYDRVTLSVFWQVPYVFVGGGDNGIYVIDATDPRRPALVARVQPEPVMRVGQVQAIGNLLIATSAEGARTLLLDISDPENPRPIPGGDFRTRGRPDGEARDAYFSNTTNGYIYYARKEGGGGLMVYDIRDPNRPGWAGALKTKGNGGYVFVHGDLAFVGQSSFAAAYDISDLGAITEVQRFDLDGDLDTITPIGNVAVLSVDDDSDDDEASAIAPWAAVPDGEPPRVTWMWPADGATVPTRSSFGFTMSEQIDVKSAWEGSVRIYPAGTDPAKTRINGFISAQESIINFVPYGPLEPGTTYTVEIPRGGITDFSGNAIEETFTATFETGGKS